MAANRTLRRSSFFGKEETFAVSSDLFFSLPQEPVLFGEAQILQMAIEQLPVFLFLIKLPTSKITWISRQPAKHIHGALAEFTSSEVSFKEHVQPDDYPIFALAADFLRQNPAEVFTGRFSTVPNYSGNSANFALTVKVLPASLHVSETALGIAMDITDTAASLKPKIPKENELLARLSPREKEVLQLVVEGYNDKHISEILTISIYTAAVHRKNLLKKLGVKNTASLVRVAIESGTL